MRALLTQGLRTLGLDESARKRSSASLRCCWRKIK